VATEMAGHDVSPGAQPPFGASSAIQSWLFCTWPTYSPRTTVNRAYSAGRMWISASGLASPVLRWYGRRVGGLGPGLTS
jgi:hypothetical protein